MNVSLSCINALVDYIYRLEETYKISNDFMLYYINDSSSSFFIEYNIKLQQLESIRTYTNKITYIHEFRRAVKLLIYFQKTVFSLDDLVSKYRNLSLCSMNKSMFMPEKYIQVVLRLKKNLNGKLLKKYSEKQKYLNHQLILYHKNKPIYTICDNTSCFIDYCVLIKKILTELFLLRAMTEKDTHTISNYYNEIDICENELVFIFGISLFTVRQVFSIFDKILEVKRTLFTVHDIYNAEKVLLPDFVITINYNNLSDMFEVINKTCSYKYLGQYWDTLQRINASLIRKMTSKSLKKIINLITCN